jgi:hypothetical protein
MIKKEAVTERRCRRHMLSIVEEILKSVCVCVYMILSQLDQLIADIL